MSNQENYVSVYSRIANDHFNSFTADKKSCNEIQKDTETEGYTKYAYLLIR